MCARVCICVCACVFGSDPGQRHHLYVWEPGGGVPQTPDGPGPEADLPGHLQLHQVPHQAGVRKAPAGTDTTSTPGNPP